MSSKVITDLKFFINQQNSDRAIVDISSVNGPYMFCRALFFYINLICQLFDKKMLKPTQSYFGYLRTTYW